MMVSFPRLTLLDRGENSTRQSREKSNFCLCHSSLGGGAQSVLRVTAADRDSTPTGSADGSTSLPAIAYGFDVCEHFPEHRN